MSDFEKLDGLLILSAKIHQFTNESIHLPGRETEAEYSGGIDTILEGHLKVFANGFSEDTKDYICFEYHNDIRNLEIRCIISVADVLGRQRFPQSFTITDMEKKEYEQMSYISRETLLKERDELLPNDTLTLIISMLYNTSQFTNVTKSSKGMNSYRETEMKIRPTFEVRENADGISSRELILDSYLAKCLAKESNYFRAIKITPMAERSANAMHVDESEFQTFQYIQKIMMGTGLLILQSVKEIFDLYIVGDKYDIPSVIESSREFLKLCLFDHTIDDYLNFANEYESGYLRDIITKEINALRLLDFHKVTEKYRNGIRLRGPSRWLYEQGVKPLVFQEIIEVQEVIEESLSNTPIDNELESVDTFDFYN